MAAAGFRQVEAGYWKCLPFPIMVLRRKPLPPKAERTQVVELPSLLERVLNMVMALERGIARTGAPIPVRLFRASCRGEVTGAMPRPYVLGLLGEYLGRLFRTVDRKPQLLIRKVVPPAAGQRPPVAVALP